MNKRMTFSFPFILLQNIDLGKGPHRGPGGGYWILCLASMSFQFFGEKISISSAHKIEIEDEGRREL
jgi:hypothetical protein